MASTMQQLAECQRLHAQERLKLQMVESQCVREENSAQHLQSTLEQQQARMQSTIQQHVSETAALKQQSQAETQQISHRLAIAEQESQALMVQLHQERQTFQASLLSQADSMRSTPWKDKLLAVRAELAVVREERDRLAMQQ